MVCRETSLNIGEPEVRYCYGMSKMTVVNEIRANYKNYFKMHETEFMEFIVRLAFYKFQSTQYTMGLKVELILDELLKIIGYKRITIRINEDEISESDDDY